jgi:hypothetical protein
MIVDMYRANPDRFVLGPSHTSRGEQQTHRNIIHTRPDGTIKFYHAYETPKDAKRMFWTHVTSVGARGTHVVTIAAFGKRGPA